jgi:hypothetical protein
VLQALGLLDDLAVLADPSKDIVGQQLMSAGLPKRARISSRKRSDGDG